MEQRPATVIKTEYGYVLQIDDPKGGLPLEIDMSCKSEVAEALYELATMVGLGVGHFYVTESE